MHRIFWALQHHEGEFRVPGQEHRHGRRRFDGRRLELRPSRQRQIGSCRGACRPAGADEDIAAKALSTLNALARDDEERVASPSKPVGRKKGTRKVGGKRQKVRCGLVVAPQALPSPPCHAQVLWPCGE